MAKFHGPKIYGTVTVGERGQIAIPVELRKYFGIKAGDKLFVFSKGKEFINLIPAGQFNEFLTNMTEMFAKIKKDNPDITK